MTELPRSRALVRMDGPGHIMPVEPVTPPDSTVWRVVHFPVMLGVVAVGLLLVAVLAIKLLGLGFQFVSYVPGARYLVPLIAATVIVTVYWVFVRIVERRPDIEELGASEGLKELGLGFCGGLALSLATFAILGLCGSLRVFGFNPPQAMLVPFVAQLCTAIVLEILLRGLAFRLVERLLGSWITLVLTVIGFAAAAQFLDDDPTPFAMLAVVLESGLICAALYMVTRRLWAAIGLHAAWNFAQVGLYGVSLASGPYGFVLSQVTGPDWLTGGRAGTEASVPALVVNALAIAALLAVAVRRGRIVRPIWQRGRTA